MLFSLFVLGSVLLILVRTVNNKLNNPGDTSLEPDDTEPQPKEDVNIPVTEPLDKPSEPKQPAVQPEAAPISTEEKPRTAEKPLWETKAKGEAPVRPNSSYGHLFGLIGKPLAHSASKVRFNKMFREQHIDAHYENFELDSIEQVKDLVESNPNLCGFNVTIPYKQDIIPYLNRLDETAEAIGAVNTVKVLHRDGGVELVGYNTDWIGFCKSFGELIEGHHKALILGTGGVSKAVKYALDSLGIENKFVSRNSTFDIMGYYELSPSIMDEYDVIVNCTPMGMWPETGQCPDIPYTFLSENHLLLDVIANPEETLFMKKGREHGATAKGGKDMLEQQAVAAWEIWNRIGE